MSSVTRKVALITGANRGIGNALARKLAGSEYTVILAARSLTAAQEAAKQISSDDKSVLGIQLDVEDAASIRACADRVEREYGKLDVLVNNAGICLDFEIRAGKYTDQEAWTKTYNVNVYGTHLVTKAFAPLLLKSSSNPRLIFVSSSVGSLGLDVDVDMVYNRPLPAAPWPKADEGGMTSYRASKAALNMLARDWRRVLHEDGVKVHILCPGRVATTFGGWTSEQAKTQGATDTDAPATFIKGVVGGERDEDEGKFIHQGGVYPF